MGVILSAFDRSFFSLDARSRDLLSRIPEESLFAKPRETPNAMAMFSCGEYLLRSAAMVEKTFGGITTRLWDDPFEWTLPEKLATRAEITRYFDEVEATRLKGFAFFASDNDLARNARPRKADADRRDTDRNARKSRAFSGTCVRCLPDAARR
ncbi:MAG: hypothetical protein QM785_14405 [Pyrinomonadaceae bacterium]